MTHSPIILAVDTTDLDAAKALAADVAPHLGMVKLGLEFFTRHGPAGIRAVQEHAKLPVFLDLKFHDIPNTVAGAIHAISPLSPRLLTIHASGGTAMIQAAREAIDSHTPTTGLLAVTILTSLDNEAMRDIGFASDDPEYQVLKLTELALNAGASGIVCSPKEITAIRAAHGKDFTIVTPGIRPAGSAKDDQQRTLTPKEAMDTGANWLVIGRPITKADSPKNAAEAIAKDIIN